MIGERSLSRREVIKICGIGLLARPLVTMAGCGKQTRRAFLEPKGAPYEGTDAQLLDEIQRETLQFFWDDASQKTGQVQEPDLATKIYERIDWPWMLDGASTLSMGWTPESGFLNARWEHYCELMMIYLLAVGSPTHPIPASSWDAWTRPRIQYQGIDYISGNDPIFTHQYSQAWFDFRKKRDAYADYFENSVKATTAHKLFCMSLDHKFPDYSEN